MSDPNERHRRTMKRFWETKAAEHAPFYIATWRGYDRRDTEDFFLTPEEAERFLSDAGYRATGQDRMLEIGCGIGRMTRGFAALVGEVDAIDVSAEMVRQARENLAGCPNVRVHETSGTDLAAFPDRHFDLVFSFIVFQHLPDKAIVVGYVRESGRVLRPGGTLHFQVSGLPDPDAGRSAASLALRRSYRRWLRRPLLAARDRLRGGPGGFASPAWSGCRMTAQEARAACLAAGLRVERIVGEGTQYMWVTARRPSV